MEADQHYLHRLDANNSWKTLWDWLGDRGIFFCEDTKDILLNSPKTMLRCFTILHYTGDMVFWKLHRDADKLGIHDPLGFFLDSDLNEDEIGLFTTHTRDGNEINEPEQSGVVPLKWWNEHKEDNDIREQYDEFVSSVTYW